MDKSPAYIRTPSVPSSLTSLYSPSMVKRSTFVVMLRDPTDRLFSEFKHHQSHGRMGSSSFSQFANSSLSLHHSLCKDMDYASCFTALSGEDGRSYAIVSGKIDEQLSLWLQTVPPSSLLLVSFKGYVSSGEGRGRC